MWTPAKPWRTSFIRSPSATNFLWPLTQAQFLRGWLATHGADIDTGFEEMLRVSLELASNVMRPIFLGLIAARQINAARLEDATKTLERATKDIREQQARFYEPEVIRLGGEVLLAQSAANAAQAESVFRQAMALATEQSSRMLELRSAVSLARQLGSGGRKSEARDLLAPVYNAFTEGFGRADLQTAKTLLAGLS